MTTNPDGKISEQSYDALNRLVARALTDVRRVVLIGRDRWDQEVGVTDPRGNTTTLAFDRLGRRVSETKPRGGVTSFTYDEVGNVRRITDPRQMSVESLYDDAGRKQYEKMWPSPEATTPSKTITYSYNDRDDLIGWDDGEMSGTFNIAPLGREAASSVDYGPFTKGSSTTYFRNGLQKTFTGPDEVTYGYADDPGGRLRSIAIPGEGSII